MSHFAQIDDQGVVVRVTTGDNAMSDQEAHDWLIQNLGGTWVQTSYSGAIRKNFAGIGYTYDAQRDAFIPPNPFDSWLLDEETCQWAAPVPYPQDGKLYQWIEPEGWVEVSA